MKNLTSKLWTKSFLRWNKNKNKNVGRFKLVPNLHPRFGNLEKNWKIKKEVHIGPLTFLISSLLGPREPPNLPNLASLEGKVKWIGSAQQWHRGTSCFCHCCPLPSFFFLSPSFFATTSITPHQEHTHKTKRKNKEGSSFFSLVLHSYSKCCNCSRLCGRLHGSATTTVRKGFATPLPTPSFWFFFSLLATCNWPRALSSWQWWNRSTYASVIVATYTDTKKKRKTKQQEKKDRNDPLQQW